MDKYQDYVRAVRELGLQPLRIDEFESLTGVMSMSEIINLTAKKSGTDREELAEGTKKETEPMMMASMDEQKFMELVSELMEQGFSQQEAIEEAKEIIKLLGLKKLARYSPYRIKIAALIKARAMENPIPQKAANLES